MRSRLFALFVAGCTLCATARGQDWGERVTDWHATTNIYRYDVYRSNFVYAAAPFLITDIREDDTNAPPFTVYSDKNGVETRSVDVYRAYDGTNMLVDQPVVVYVHGGAWVDGYMNWYEYVAQPFTGARGWVTVVVDYRLTSSNVFLADGFCPDRTHCPPSPDRTKAAWYPDNIDDVSNAFQWVVHNIAQHGGNTNRIVLFGHSAGAHLVSLLVTHTNYAPSSVPYTKGVISMSGLYAFTNLDPLVLNVFREEMEQTWHGGITDKPALAEASPDTYLATDRALPPFYLMYCEEFPYDLPQFKVQATSFVARLESLGHVVTNTLLPTNFNHVTEMQAIAGTNELPTKLIIGYIEDVLYLRDLNTNGIVDWWEMDYFGNLTNVTDASDFDEDGFLDRFEYPAGTSPTDSNSLLKTTAIAPGADGFTIRWSSVSNRYYAVCASTNPAQGFQPLATNIYAEPPENAYTDSVALPPVRVYRVEIESH